MSNREAYTGNISGLKVDAPNNSQFVGKIGGYAVVFNEPSENLGGFIEYISPSAFNGVNMTDVVALFNHNFENVLGRTSAGTLQLNIDKKGLHFSLEIPNTTLGNDIYTNIKAGNLKSMSFKFVLGRDSWTRAPDGTPQRMIEEIKALHEISVVTIPAYPETTVAVTRALKNDAYKQKVLAVLKLYE